MKPLLGLAALSLSLVLAGCGGSSNAPVAAAKGKATLRVLWPVREGRAIPEAANSIRINLFSGSAQVATVLVARPTVGNETETEFKDLPVGTLSVAIDAFPNVDGTGVAQGVGKGTLTTNIDTPGTATISLVSTAATLSISPATIRVGKGTSTTLGLNALDRDGHVVLLSAGGGTETVEWTSDNPAVATIVGHGIAPTLKGLAAGTVHVTAKLAIDDAGHVVTGTGTGTVVAASGTVIVK